MPPDWGCFACSSTWWVFCLSLFLPTGFLILILSISSMSLWGRMKWVAGWVLGCQAGSATTVICIFTVLYTSIPSICYWLPLQSQLSVDFSISNFLTSNIITAVKMHFLAFFFFLYFCLLFPSIFNRIKIIYWCSIAGLCWCLTILRSYVQTFSEKVTLKILCFHWCSTGNYLTPICS